MIYVIIIANILLGVAAVSAYYLPIGLAYLAFCGLMMTPICDTSVGHFFMRRQMRRWGSDVDQYVFSNKRLLMSVSCLTFALKIAALIVAFVEAGAVVLIVIAILIATGFFFEGYASGMTVGLAYYIARFAVKIASILTIGFDTVAVWIAKLELKILNIKY